MEVNNISQGQRVMITSLQDARGWKGREMVTIPAGASFEGIVNELTADGFFELRTDTGDSLSFSVNDRSIMVIEIEPGLRK